MLLFDAMRRSRDLSPDAIRDAIADTRGFQGATGTITIDEEHNAIKPAVIVKITQHNFHYATQVSVR